MGDAAPAKRRREGGERRGKWEGGAAKTRAAEVSDRPRGPGLRLPTGCDVPAEWPRAGGSDEPEYWSNEAVRVECKACARAAASVDWCK